MKSLIQKTSLLILAMILPLVVGSSVFAQVDPGTFDEPGPDGSSCELRQQVVLPTWYKYLNGESIGDKCNPTIDFVENPADIGKILLAIFEIILWLAGVIAVIFIIFGGFKYLISQGEPDKVKGAKTTVLNAVIGLVITMISVGIVNVIGRNLI